MIMAVPRERSIWPWVLLLALLIHLLFFWITPGFSPSKPQQFTLEDISPKALEQLRNQWQKDKSLLISPDDAKPVDRPEDARYISDRNRRVEKETQAKVSDTVPRPGQGTAKQGKEKTGSKKIALRDLGVSFAPRPKEEVDEGESQAGAHQTLLDKNLQYGNSNALNTEESVYYSFYSRIYNAIAPLWQSEIRSIPQRRSLPEGDYVTAIDLVLDADGHLVRVDQLQSSSIPEFDQAVHRTLRKLNHFPNPPKDLIKRDGLVHTQWTFSVRVDQRVGYSYGDPQGNY